MMATTLSNHVKAARAPFFTPVRPSLLQRKCACGGSPGLAECGECSKKRRSTTPHTSSPGHNITDNDDAALETNNRQAAQITRGYAFSRVRIHSEPHGVDGIFING